MTAFTLPVGWSIIKLMLRCSPDGTRSKPALDVTRTVALYNRSLLSSHHWLFQRKTHWRCVTFSTEIADRLSWWVMFKIITSCNQEASALGKIAPAHVEPCLGHDSWYQSDKMDALADNVCIALWTGGQPAAKKIYCSTNLDQGSLTLRLKV